MATATTVSALRVVLLGNSWSVRSSVVNCLLGKTELNTEKEPDKCLRIRAKIEEKCVSFINTPDLLNPDISEDKLTDHVTDCVRLSDPGPHLFLLVLQPEDFSEAQKLRLCRILKRFGDKSFDHSFILISPRKPSSIAPSRDTPLKYLIRELRYRYLELAHLELPLLYKRLSQIMKMHDGEDVSCDVFMDLTADSQRTQQEKTRHRIPRAVNSADLCVSDDSTSIPREIRILLLGKNDDKLAKLRDFITRKECRLHFFPKLLTGQQTLETGQWRGKPLKVLEPADVFSLSVEKLRVEMKNCVSLCPPGPNVLLLLVKPSEFTEENRQTLNIILSLFGPDAFKHSMVIRTDEDGQPDDSFRRLLRDCGERHYNMSENNHRSLMTQIKSLVDENRGAFLTLTEELMTLKPEKMKPALNLVLCGRRGAEKSSAAEAILGQTGLHSASTSSECVQHQGEVCGRWVSLVDLPALSGKPLETVMKEAFRSVSLCDPEGVHAFVLVLPVSPLTDDDKKELETIQDVFGSQVNDFTLILFTAESDPTDPAVVDFQKKNKGSQELVQSCGGRHFVLNIKNQQQIPELLNLVEKIGLSFTKDKPCSFTTETFAHVQTEKISNLKDELEDMKTKCLISCDGEKQSPECLRVVLIGKTGSGKSSSGNTILGRKEFLARANQTSVTKHCQKAHGEVNGRLVAVVDTPGLFDKSVSIEEAHEEMIKCINLLAPGPHVFLLVLQIGRFTKEQNETLKLIREGFGKGAEKFTIILLTGGDSLEHDNVSIEEYVKTGSDESFKKLISDCGDRYHVFDNRDDGNTKQVSELIKKIDTMVENNRGSCYTNAMLQEAETAIKKETERILKVKEEEMKKEREELKRKHEEEMKVMEKRMKKQEEDMKRQREKELRDKEDIIKKEQEAKRVEKEKREAEDREKKKLEKLQRLEWKNKFRALEEKIKLESEEKESIHRQLEETRVKMRQERESIEKKQKEWWEKRNQEEEQRREEERTRIRKLQEEFEQERENYENKQKAEDMKRQEEAEKKKSEQREEIEKDRKQKEEELKKMEEQIKKGHETRLKEQQIREEEDWKRKLQEDLQRLGIKSKLEAMERKIKSEEKESIHRQLEETREKVREERERLEKEQKEWWEKRNREEEVRRQEEETKMRKLQEEFEQERENYEKKRKEEDLKRKEEEDKLQIQQREEIKKERKQKEKELKVIEEHIKEELEVRLREQKRREEEDRRKKEEEERQRLEWKNTLIALEKKIKSESEKKETTERQLDESRKQLKKERDSWEKKQTDWWEERFQENEQIRYEEQTKLKKLQEEYETEKEKEKKRREGQDRVRKKQEEKEKKAIELKFKAEMEDLKKTHEEDARKKAEEFNNFKEKYNKEYATQKEQYDQKMKDKEEQYDLLKALKAHNEEQLEKKYRAGLYDAVKLVTKNKQNMQKINNLLKKHKKEMKKEETEREREKLKETHEEEITKLLEELMEDVDSSMCTIL